MREQTQRRAPATDPWGDAAPRFGGTAALSVEREGKAAGGRVAAHFVGCCVRRCVLCFVLCCGCEQV